MIYQVVDQHPKVEQLILIHVQKQVEACYEIVQVNFILTIVQVYVFVSLKSKFLFPFLRQ